MNKPDRSLSAALGLFAALVLLVGSAAQRAPQDRNRQIDQLLRAYYQNEQFNGSVLVAEKGKVIYKNGFGFANKEWAISNQPETKFRIGSITKSFTALLILQLVEQGQVDLNGTIEDYLPEYRQDIGRKVTIHHLLTQTSGIQEFFQLPGFYEEAGLKRHAPADFVRQYCGRWLRYEPGRRFEYCNSGYFILGLIIEKVTGRPYAEILSEKILRPLGMNDTGIEESGSIVPNRASGYEKTMDGYVAASYIDMSIPYAAGAMYSTVEDLLKWDRALAGNRLLGAGFRELLFHPYIDAIGAHYGYGWVIDKKKLSGPGDEVACLWHGGVVNGFNSLMERDVDQDRVIILLNNTGLTYLYEMAEGIRNILYGRSYKQPGRSIAQALRPVLAEQGAAAAVRQYRELRANHAGEYNFHVFELYRLGLDLVAKNEIQDATAICELNAEAHPDEPITYDCLGSVYGLSGDKWLAIKNYGKSLELDPGNIPAIEKMRGLLESGAYAPAGTGRSEVKKKEAT